MASPAWKLLLIFEVGSQISSPRFGSDLCPCRCCWCEKCEVKKFSELPVSGLPRFHSSDDPTKQPLWSLVLIFADGSEFPSRPLKPAVGLCRYCWCEKREAEQIPESDLSAFRSSFSLSATESLKVLLAGVESTEESASFLQINSQTNSQASAADENKPLSLEELLQQRSKSFLDDTEANGSDDELFQSESDDYHTSNNTDDGDPPWTESSDFDDQHHESYAKFQSLKRPMQNCTSKKPYQCDLCPSAFNSSNQLTVHKRIHAREVQHVSRKTKRRNKNSSTRHKFWCTECRSSFDDNDSLNRHLKQKHSQTHPFKCGLCSERFKKRSEKIMHQRTHKDANGRYNCNQCEFSYEQPIYLRRHVLQSHSQNNPPTCTNEVKEKRQTVSHHHKDLRTLKTYSKISGNPESGKSAEPIFVSSASQKISDGSVSKPSTSAQNNFKQTPSTSTCTNKPMIPEKLLQDSPEKDKPFSCSLCKSKFTTKKRKNIHLRKHKGGDGLYECKDCDYTSKLISQMIKHTEIHPRGKHQISGSSEKKPTKKSVHHTRNDQVGLRSDGSFQCDQCFKIFSCLYNLRRHKLIHSGKRLHRCNQCSKSFLVSDQLIRHKRTHSGERPYKCGQCSKSFSRKYCLTKHQRIHAGESSAQCGLCFKTLGSSCSLRRHQKAVHKMFI